MTDYTAFIAKWGTLTGTTQEKLDAVNAATAQPPAQRAIFTPSQIINACDPGELATLTTAQVAMLTLILQGSQVDGSVGTTVRAAVVAIFSGKPNSIAGLSALVAPFDTPPPEPWWIVNGYARPFTMGDVALAGVS